MHFYALCNTSVKISSRVARQKPDASNVAGIRAWNSLGRFVKRGEKGILILAPMVGKKRAKDDGAEPSEDAKGTVPTLFGFRAVYVFDVTQTEGKELPTLTEVQGDVSGYRERHLVRRKDVLST
jgi:antirestriction protein ArdC